jgi:membrane protein YdbS with pleckstrin-like domain
MEHSRRESARLMNIPLKTVLVLMVAIATFNLGRYSVEFSGNAAAWAAVVSCLVILAISLFALMFWRPNA